MHMRDALARDVAATVRDAVARMQDRDEQRFASMRLVAGNARVAYLYINAALTEKIDNA